MAVRGIGTDVFGREVALWSPYWHGGAQCRADDLLTVEECEAAAYQYEDDKRRCPQCRWACRIVVKLSAISSTGWMAKCGNCDHRWEVPAAVNEQSETAERTRRIASVIRRGKRGHGQKLYKYDQRLYRRHRELRRPEV